MAVVVKIVYLIFFQLFILLKNADAYAAMVDFEIVRFRILDREKAAGGQQCDTDHWINQYNPCDFVFYVKNCTQAPHDGGQQCSTRINRYYGPDNTDDVSFSEGSRPATSFFIDGIARETVIRVEVLDQDDGWSADDPVGVYQIRVTPESIDPRGPQVAPINEQVIIIPDHSELTIHFRSYCLDEDCRIRRPFLQEPRAAQPGVFVQPGQTRSNDQPTEAWTISNNGKDPSVWSGPLRSFAVQQPVGPRPGAGFQPGLGVVGGQPDTQPVGQGNNLYPSILPPQALHGLAPSYGQRPPFVEWSKENTLQRQPGFSPSVVAAPPGLENLIDNSPVTQQQLQARAPHLLGFHCENGRCSSDQSPTANGGQQRQKLQQTQGAQKQELVHEEKGVKLLRQQKDESRADSAPKMEGHNSTTNDPS